MTDDRLYTLRQISQELELPESTVRYYRDSFSAYLPTVGTGRRRRYPEKAVAVLRIVADAYAQNRSREEIEAYLDSTQTEPVEAEPVVGFDSRSRDRDDREEPIGRYIEGERDRRDALWHMAREIVRLGEAIDRQGVMMGELAKQLTDQANRTLPTPSPPTPEPQTARQPQAAPVPPAAQPQTTPPPQQQEAAPQPQPAATLGVVETPPPIVAIPQPPEVAPIGVPATDPTAPDAVPRVASHMAEQKPLSPSTTAEPQAESTQPPQPPKPVAPTEPTPGASTDDLDDVAQQLATLREQLARERDLVERLRKSKMDVERRAAEAESRLGYGSEPPIPRASRKSMFTRFFNQG